MSNDNYYRVSLENARDVMRARLAKLRVEEDEPTGKGVAVYADRAAEDESVAVAALSGSEFTATLHLVETALKRIENGTFGRCAVDGKRIEEKRLMAIPWVTLCLKHQAQQDEIGGTKTFTM